MRNVTVTRTLVSSESQLLALILNNNIPMLHGKEIVSLS